MIKYLLCVLLHAICHQLLSVFYSFFKPILNHLNIIMNQKILNMLFNNLSERNDNQGITYEDVRIIIIKKVI